MNFWLGQFLMAFLHSAIVLGCWRSNDLVIYLLSLAQSPCHLGSWHPFIFIFWCDFFAQEKEAEFLAQNKAIYGDKEVLSQVMLFNSVIKFLKTWCSNMFSTVAFLSWHLQMSPLSIIVHINVVSFCCPCCSYI